jgi:hypothetical protein
LNGGRVDRASPLSGSFQSLTSHTPNPPIHQSTVF